MTDLHLALLLIVQNAALIAAHYWSLKAVEGKTRVGANSAMAEITKEEWDKVKRYINFGAIVLIEKEPCQHTNTNAK